MFFLNISKAQKLSKRALFLKYILSDFLKNKKQRIILNERFWSSGVKFTSSSEIHFGSSCLFLFYKDLGDDLSSYPKLLTDATSIFLVIYNINTFGNELKRDSCKIDNLAFE